MTRSMQRAPRAESALHPQKAHVPSHLKEQENMALELTKVKKRKQSQEECFY